MILISEPNVDSFDENGLTALMWASAYGQFPIVAALLQSGAKADLENPQGQTSLLFAAFGGYHEVVRILMMNGANVNHVDNVSHDYYEKKIKSADVFWTDPADAVRIKPIQISNFKKN